MFGIGLAEIFTFEGLLIIAGITIIFLLYKIYKKNKEESKMQKMRQPCTVILLSIITFGIYWFYWYYSINKELLDHSGGKSLFHRVDACISILPDCEFCQPL